MNTMAKTTGLSKTFLITSSSLALQSVYIQLCTLPLRLEPGCVALIGGFGPNVKLYFWRFWILLLMVYPFLTETKIL